MRASDSYSKAGRLAVSAAVPSPASSTPGGRPSGSEPSTAPACPVPTFTPSVSSQRFWVNWLWELLTDGRDSDALGAIDGIVVLSRSITIPAHVVVVVVVFWWERELGD